MTNQLTLVRLLNSWHFCFSNRPQILHNPTNTPKDFILSTLLCVTSSCICSGTAQIKGCNTSPHCCHSLTWRQSTGLLVFQFVHNPEGFQKLSEVNTAVLVEVDASGEVVNSLVVNVHPQVGTEETPDLTKLLDGDQTWTQFIQYNLICIQCRPWELLTRPYILLTWVVFVYDVKYYLNVCLVSEQSFSQVWSDLRGDRPLTSDLAKTLQRSTNSRISFCDSAI